MQQYVSKFVQSHLTVKDALIRKMKGKPPSTSLSSEPLRLAFSPCEATSEQNKLALVLPVGFIALVEMGKVVRGVQHHPKGCIKLYTHCTVTPVSCMEPQLVTLYMSAKDMDAFNMALGIASKKYLRQNLFFKQQGDA